MAQTQDDDDSMYLYDVNSKMLVGAHIFPLQYYDLVCCFHLVHGSLTTILPSGIKKGIRRLSLTHTHLLVLIARTLTRAV